MSKLTKEENKIWDNKVDIFQGKENSKKFLVPMKMEKLLQKLA